MDNYTEKKNKIQEEKTVLEKCTDKRLKNPKFSNYIEPLISKKMIELINDCGSFLTFLGDFEMENKKLHKGSFCKNRFCPMCSWRMSCKDSLEITILMEHLRKEENKEFIFLTLTTPNVKGYELDGSIKAYNKSFKKLMERKEVKGIVKGYIRKLEVTYQKEKYITKELWQKKKDYYKKKGLEIGDLEPNYDTYNPHFHVVIAVDKSYFTSRNYINRDRWLELWQESTGDYSITQVDIRKAKASNGKEVYELAKYSAKDSDYLVSRPVFEIFYKALKGKQSLAFGGLFQDAHKMYKLHELDVYKKQDEIQYVYMLYYNWHKKEYENTKIRELTEDERMNINGKLIDEIEVD
ncbi:replication protein [Clostridium botulinum]|uniref:Replication protein n=1 Tax=Clostridium botulinum TaxID=1491 RepID=A0A6B4Y4Y1_CLOBO|nr:protein rep [Clostridium sporogenes]NFA18582.1 replication protein [Clostridium botulinum]NFF03730.1 replication protein [Clostridium botulinum]NFG32527.1 replication protein [Clostridium botulinum]NFH74504.1 replication protein [Clostridium botulinum]NFI02740.1 replication protein [Clostridium botulinum]